jgi:hypothetical protein
LSDSYITGPGLDGFTPLRVPGPTGPAVTGKPGKAQERASGSPDPGRSQGEATPGRWTINGRGRRPWVAPHSDSDHHRPGPAARGSGWTGRRPMHKASRARVRVQAGSNPRSSWSTPIEEGPQRPTNMSRGPTILERLSLTPGRLGSPRGQRPARTYPAPGKRRADARIQSPSGTRQLGINSS